METAAAQLFAVKESLHHLRDCIVFNRQPFKTLQEGCRMLMVKIMIYLAAVSAVIIFFMGASGGDEP